MRCIHFCENLQKILLLEALKYGGTSINTGLEEHRLYSMLSLLSVLSLAATALCASSASDAPQWRFDLKPNLSGIVALEAIVVNTTLVVIFDRATGDQPLQINGHSAWGGLWDLETSTVRPLDVLTDSFCASGALLSNGNMVR